MALLHQAGETVVLPDASTEMNARSSSSGVFTFFSDQTESSPSAGFKEQQEVWPQRPDCELILAKRVN
jgi:hypothetical protein